MAIDWTEEIVARLGLEPDARIAEEIGVSRETIRQQRKKRGIPKFVTSKTLPAGVIELLGTVPDTQLAAEYSVPCSRVAAERRKRGLQVPTPDTKAQGLLRDIEWGHLTDSEVAEKFGLSSITVTRYRKANAIPSARKRGRRIVRRQMPDTFEHEGVDYTPWLAVFPRVSNKQLAAQVGVNEHKIAIVREMLGVPTYHRQPDDPIGLNWAEVTCWLGKKSDMDIATQFGISSSRVNTLRRACGIEAYDHRVNDTKKVRFLRMVKSGVEQEDAREQCGMSKSYVANLLKEEGLRCY